MTRPEAGLARRALLRYAAAGGAGAAVPALLASGAAAGTTDGGGDGDALVLQNHAISLRWQHTPDGWALTWLRRKRHNGWRTVLTPSGRYGIWSAGSAPDADSVRRVTAGTRMSFLPQRASRRGQTITFVATQPTGTMRAVWRLDPAAATDVLVTLTWTPNSAGWYSIPSPTLGTLADDDLGWGVIPGYWSSATSATDDTLTYQYQVGVPTVPLVTTEATTTSLSAILRSRTQDVTLAVIADPSLARDPWASNASTQSTWQVGMSLRALTGELSPTSVYPVLGQAGSQLAAGESVTATFRYVLSDDGWYEVAKHATRDVYRLGDYLALASAANSLSHRINRMHDFIVSPRSQWHTWEYAGLTLGAESGKLSDVGAMWMMDRLTGDPIIRHDRLPVARNFKLAQQQTTEGPFHGAALGEYFMNGGWVSELPWTNNPTPDYVSPIFTTFYTLADMGNIALFDPSDTEIRDRIRLGAEKLLSWQHDDGSFDIGYQREKPDVRQYPELPDLRATWYGFVAAYRILGDARYLAAARRGADWFIEHAVTTGDFVGVCDDARLTRDFSVIFAAQALLDLHELTGVPFYRDAAIACARFYTLHIFDHPTATTTTKTFHGVEMADWQTSQVGLSYERSGYTGSARWAGPILLASHAGAFVRFFQLTGDVHFLDLARAAARGRDAFVGASSGIPSYYWSAGNGGDSVYPWHGWWHIGWVLDYLLAEAHLRTGGKVSFPPGLCTAKVGSHRPYGFAAGRLYGQPVDLWMPRTLLTVDDPNVDVITARSTDGTRAYVVALNQLGRATSATVTLNPRGVEPGRRASWTGWRAVTGKVARTGDAEWSLSLPPNGVAVLAVDVSLSDDPLGPELRGVTVDGEPLTPLVFWSYLATVESWAQWRVAGAQTWTDTAHETGYAFTQTLDLSTLERPTVVQVRVATRLPDGTVGYSPSTEWKVPEVYIPDGPNLALNRPVEVSSTYQPRYTGDLAVDGNATSNASRWLSALGDAQPSITVHLAAPTTPRLVRLYTGGGTLSLRIVAGIVQTRGSDGTWAQVGAFTGNTLPVVDIPIDSGPTDQVRLVVTERSTDEIDVARVHELEIYDKVR
ncbi:hypothetical protein AAH979_05830 [Plantactinospora sp. ZYX-F-223]|uniref:discoidin domain-containing protein n=1 Tax=Plantactinospora sp. ZYX-F-223 TaxID=3144103 RepID=UPI0031FC9360